MTSSKPSLIDTHCHLDGDYASESGPYGPTRPADELIREAQESGVTTLITVATDMASVERVRAISERHERVYHTVGVHPHEAKTLQPGDLEKLRQAARHPKCRAIGELGLDYHYDHSPREEQRETLRQQLELALEADLPVVVHSREAEDDLLVELRKYAPRVRAGTVPGVIHCFTGTREFAKATLELGFFLSFSGILTFKNAEELRSIAREAPLDRVMVETDSPFLAPIPHRGKKCEPSMVRFTAMKLAEIRSLALDEIARATNENAARLFKLP